MATITQQPARLDLRIVAGDPFGLLLTVAVTDAEGDPVPWSNVTNPVVVVSDRRFDGPVPTITSPESGQWLLTWTANQTESLNGFSQWSLSATINGDGPLALIAGNLSTCDSTVPGSGNSSSASLTVEVGTANATINATTGATGPTGPQGQSGTNNGNATFIAATTPTQNVDLSTGADVYAVTASASCTYTFTNVPGTPGIREWIVQMVQDATGGWTPTFSGVKWANGAGQPTTQTGANKISLWSFVAINGTVFGALAGDAWA